MQFIHAADIHIDSPLRRLEVYEGAPVEEIRGATRKAFENLIELALSYQVSFVILAGDLFDGDWPDFNTGLFFVKQMAKLNDVGIKVFLVRGNHDAESKITRKLRLPPNVIIFPADKAKTEILEDLGVAIHGQSFSQPAVTQDLATSYPERKIDFFNIGVLHTCATGREGHDNYAPCQIDTLISKGYDYWALGHVHKREILHEEPWIIFPGNLQGRHIKEAGRKGCELVTVEDAKIVSIEQQCLDVFRWEVIEVDASGFETSEDVLNQLEVQFTAQMKKAEERPFAARVRIFGSCKAHNLIAATPESWKEQVRALALDIGFDKIWIEKIKIETSPLLSINANLEGKDPISDLAKLIQNWKKNDEKLAQLPALWADLKRKLPAEITEGEHSPLPNNAEEIRGVLNEVGNALLPRLLEPTDL